MFILFQLRSLVLQILIFLFCLVELGSILFHKLVFTATILFELFEKLHFIIHFSDVFLIQLLLVFALVFVELKFFNDGLLAIDGVEMLFDFPFVKGQFQSHGCLVLFELFGLFYLFSLPAS